jgi:hypothetical protein
MEQIFLIKNDRMWHTTYMARARGPVAAAGHEVKRNPNLESHSDMYLVRL